MRARSASLVTLSMVALAAIAWAQLSLRRDLAVVEAKLAAVQDGMTPIHTRCALLEERLEVVDQDAALTGQTVAALDESLGTHAGLLAQDRLELQALSGHLVASREEASRQSADIQAVLVGHTQRAEAVEAGLVELSDLMAQLENQLAGMPAGTILPWLPGPSGLPADWLLCDGSLGTPDLRGRFLRGVGRPEQAGLYVESAHMQAAGLHTHATDRNRSTYSVPVTDPPTSWQPGEGLILSDMGIVRLDPDTRSAHGEHVHQDEHVPQHFTVVFIMKRPL